MNALAVAALTSLVTLGLVFWLKRSLARLPRPVPVPVRARRVRQHRRRAR
jgi:hypothetical protein